MTDQNHAELADWQRRFDEAHPHLVNPLHAVLLEQTNRIQRLALEMEETNRLQLLALERLFWSRWKRARR